MQAAESNESLDVVVNNDGLHVAGQIMATTEELLSFLASRNILKIRVHVNSSPPDYQAVGKIIYGTQRAGITLELPDQAEKPEVS